MKFINYITRISGIDIYGLVSLSLFVLFFVVMLVWVFKSNKKKLAEISRIPLEQ
ncbi:MAG: CcoQ/FixQ family Cbb3-type cytochrome c oxidase assembly chaperone [Flavihumibacter sp.]